MKDRVLYEKRGRRYIPVALDVQWTALAFGKWLLTVEPGAKRLRQLDHNLSRAGVALAALGDYGKEVLITALLAESSWHVSPDHPRVLSQKSAHDMAEAAIAAMLRVAEGKK